MTIQRHTELKVYQRAFGAAMRLFEVTKEFPREERYTLVDQARRSWAEAWRKRRNETAFVSKLSDSEAESAEAQMWIQFSVECGYLNREAATHLYREYDEITAMLVHMMIHSNNWTIK